MYFNWFVDSQKCMNVGYFGNFCLSVYAYSSQFKILPQMRFTKLFTQVSTGTRKNWLNFWSRPHPHQDLDTQLFDGFFSICLTVCIFTAYSVVQMIVNIKWIKSRCERHQRFYSNITWQCAIRYWMDSQFLVIWFNRGDLVNKNTTYFMILGFMFSKSLLVATVYKL